MGSFQQKHKRKGLKKKKKVFKDGWSLNRTVFHQQFHLCILFPQSVATHTSFKENTVFIQNHWNRLLFFLFLFCLNNNFLFIYVNASTTTETSAATTTKVELLLNMHTLMVNYCYNIKHWVIFISVNTLIHHCWSVSHLSNPPPPSLFVYDSIKKYIEKTQRQ